jgi:predicted metal-dependent phosphoesterase TrpH
VILNIDLHTHTRRYSRCSVLAPDELCQAAVACGLDALAITEHQYQWSPAEIAELQARYPALKLYAGVEISCADGHDYVALGLEPGWYPARMAYPRFRALLDAHPGAFCFVAHCFRYSAEETGLAERQIDGIEVGSYNTLARPQPASGPPAIARLEQYRRWQREMGWIALYNSDAHAPKMVGTFYNLVETASGGPPGDTAALRRLLCHATVRGFQDEERIRAAFNGGG